MITLDRSLVEFATPLAGAIFALLIALVSFVFIGHGRRHLQSRRFESVRKGFEPIFDALVARSISFTEALDQLGALPAGQVRRSIESMLTADNDPPSGRRAVMRRLCEHLQLVARWRAQLSTSSRRPSGGMHLIGSIIRGGSPFEPVRRAEAAEYLGAIRHRPSWQLLVQAMDDVHPAVRNVAVRSLGRILEPESLPALAGQIESAALDSSPRISARSLRMAVAAFPVASASPLCGLLEHPHHRVRFLAADIVSLMIAREARDRTAGIPKSLPLPAELVEIFLGRLCTDESPDVRARAADVIGYLEPCRALAALMPLAEDSEWFVRLHAVRALSRPKLTSLASLASRLTDPHWRVHEAATQALCARGRTGLERLLEHFSTTDDRYSQDQIAEQIERAGLIPMLLHAYGDPAKRTETRFIEQMIRLGKSALLGGALLSQSSPPENGGRVLALLAPSAPNSGSLQRAAPTSVGESTDASAPLAEAS